MKVVFTQTVDRVAMSGETKEVKPGYARNYLFPRRWAVLPSDRRAKALRAAHAARSAELKRQQALIRELSVQWRGQTFRLKARASADGTLYGSVGVKEIKKLLGRDDLEFEAPTLKQVGAHEVKLVFADGTTVPITMMIESETAK